MTFKFDNFDPNKIGLIKRDYLGIISNVNPKLLLANLALKSNIVHIIYNTLTLKPVLNISNIASDSALYNLSAVNPNISPILVLIE